MTTTAASAQVSFVMVGHGETSIASATPTPYPAEVQGGIRSALVGIGLDAFGLAFTAGGAGASAVAIDSAAEAERRAEAEARAAAEARYASALTLARETIETASRYVGTRYRWGGASPREGFDCSGFVRFVFGRHGIDLPRVSRAQARAGRSLPRRLDELQPGDLLFFAQRGPAIDHVAIYAGEGRIIHASRRGYGVRFDDLDGDNGRFYAQHLVAVRRVIEGMDALAEFEASLEPDAAEEPAQPLGDAIEPTVAGEPSVQVAPAAI